MLGRASGRGEVLAPLGQQADVVDARAAAAADHLDAERGLDRRAVFVGDREVHHRRLTGLVLGLVGGDGDARLQAC